MARSQMEWIVGIEATMQSGYSGQRLLRLTKLLMVEFGQETSLVTSWYTMNVQ